MDFLEIAKTFGICGACLVGFAYGVWRALQWTATNLLKPMIDEHLGLVRDARAGLQRTADNTAILAELREGRGCKALALVPQAARLHMEAEKK